MKPALQPEPSNARQRSQVDTRRRILAAAAAIAREHGCLKTTIAATARGAGVAVGTVYLHFGDKDTLLAEVLKLALAELRRFLETAGGATARTAADDLERKMAGLADFVLAQPDLAAMLFDEALLASPAGADAADFLRQSQLRGLQAGRERGWYRSDLPDDLVAQGLLGSLVHILGAWARRPDPARRDDVVKTLAELRLHGLARKR